MKTAVPPYIWWCVHITKTRLFKYTENFTFKIWKLSDKNSDIFHISAQNIDGVYSLELPRRSKHRFGEAVLMSAYYLCFEQK